MKPKLLSILLLNLACRMQGQVELDLNLLSANVQPFDSHFFIYGLRETAEGTQLNVYKMNDQLQLRDSASQLIPKLTAADILRLSADTLHQNLSIHLQKKGETKLRIFRYKSTLEPIAIIEQVEVQRLNNLAMFSSTPFYFKNTAYSIRQTSDSGVKQFYLDKYSLISEKHNYDYRPEWQWAFEKKDMEAARVIGADELFVYLFAWRENQGSRAQWLLKIDSKTGILKRALKLNLKTEDAYYQFGACVTEKGKHFFLTGQKLLGNKDGRPPCENKNPLLYLFEIDSMAEIVSRDQFSIPLPKAQPSQKCSAVILRFQSFIKSPASELFAEIDLYKKEGNAACFLYSNTFTVNIKKNEEAYQLTNSPIVNQPALSGVVNGGDKLDLNGKICAEVDPHSVYTAPLVAPVKLKSASDSLQKQVLLLNKIDVRKRSKQFSILLPVKGLYQLKPIETFKLEHNANLYVLPQQKFFISHETKEGKLRIKLYNW